MIVAETLKGYAHSAFQMIFSRDSEAAAAASDTDLSSAENAGARQTSYIWIRQGSSSDEMSPGRKGVRAARLTEGAFPGQKKYAAAQRSDSVHHIERKILQSRSQSHTLFRKRKSLCHCADHAERTAMCGNDTPHFLCLTLAFFRLLCQ